MLDYQRVQNPINWVSINLSPEEEKFALYIKGEAMVPLFQEGTLLIIDPRKTPKNRDFIIVTINSTNEILCRQLIIDGQYQLLKPVNALFPAITLENEDKVIGVIIEARNTF